MLEKHGYVDVTVAGPEALADETSWEKHDLALVAPLESEQATRQAVERARKSRTPTFLDGATPSSLKNAKLGVQDRGLLELPLEVVCVDPEALTASTGAVTPGGRLGETQLQPRGSAAILHWTEVPSVPLSSDQARAWSAPPQDARLWEVDREVKVIAKFKPDGEAEGSPAIVQRDHVTLCAFELFDSLVRGFTCAPAARGGNHPAPATEGLEALLLGLIDTMYREANAVRLRVKPWPDGIRWVRTVRHDVDQPVGVDRARAVLDAHRTQRSAATWYWRAKPRRSGRRSTLEPGELVAAGLVSDQSRHEVGLRAELPWIGGAGEREVVEAATGRLVRGCSFYEGRGDFFGWQGAPSILWADKESFAHTELPGGDHRHPHRFAAVGPDGRVEVLNVICLPEALTSTAAAETGEGAVLPERVALGAHVPITVEPHVAAEEISALLDRMPTDARGDWTAAEVADWWKRTHTGGILVTRDEGGIELVANEQLDALVLEVLRPDGEQVDHVISLAPDIVTRIDV